MLLLAAGGWALQRFADVPHALVIGLLAGLIAARFVTGGSCGIRSDEPRQPVP